MEGAWRAGLSGATRAPTFPIRQVHASLTPTFPIWQVHAFTEQATKIDATDREIVAVRDKTLALHECASRLSAGSSALTTTGTAVRVEAGTEARAEGAAESGPPEAEVVAGA